MIVRNAHTRWRCDYAIGKNVIKRCRAYKTYSRLPFTHASYEIASLKWRAVLIAVALMEREVHGL